MRVFGAVLFALLTACGGDHEIDLTIVVDPSVDATTVGQIKSLEIAVLGAEPGSVRYTVGSLLTDGKTTWVYKSLTDGMIQFEVVARGDSRTFIASGKSMVLTPGSSAVSDTITLGLGPPNPTQRRLGASCMVGIDACASGFCVDGVCCESACDGACNTCNGTKPGMCTAAIAGTNPRKACNSDNGNGCGLDGTCDGAGQCRMAPRGKVCSQPSCAAGTYTAAAVCDGAGTCGTAPTRDCAPYACNTMNTACATICTTTSGCAPSVLCQAGSCGKTGLGGRCFGANDCANATCVDGYCCESTCTDGCKSCKEPGKEGSCVNVVVGGADPHKVCIDGGAPSCGKNGLCDGNGGCSTYPGGTLCGAGACSADNTMATAPRLCAGDGSACPAAAPTSCAPYVCSTDGAPGCEVSCGECTYYDAGKGPPFATSCAGGTSCVDHCLESDARFVCQ